MRETRNSRHDGGREKFFEALRVEEEFAQARSDSEKENLTATLEALLISASKQGHTGAMLKLGQLYYAHGHIEEAIEALEEAQGIDGDAPFSSGAAAGQMLAEIYEAHEPVAQADAGFASAAVEAEAVGGADVVGATTDVGV